MNTMVDHMFFWPWKLSPVQSMAWGEYKRSGFILAWGDCHKVWSDLNCGYCWIAADRTCWDEQNCWSDLCLTLKIEYSTELGVGRRQNKRFLLVWGYCINIWSDRNCGYRLISADRPCRDQHNGWSNLCPTLKIEYSTWHGMGRRQNELLYISLGGLP